jgi:hypothetical protein
VAADDGYEPARKAATMKQLYERDQVFGLPARRGRKTSCAGTRRLWTA